jgi:hypothetical protein
MQLCDISSVGVIPFVSCLFGGILATAMGADKTMEVLLIIACVILLSATLLLCLTKILDANYFSDVLLRSRILKV